MSHPDPARLALFSAGDLNFFDRLLVSRHLRHCAACAGSVEQFRAARRNLREQAAELPAGLNWDRLAAEMTGNIRVGLAAGECVNPAVNAHRRLTWKPALAIGALSAVVISGWWLNFPLEQKASLSRGFDRLIHRQSYLSETAVYLEANRTGLRFTENGSSMTMKHPGSAPAVISVSTEGAMRARYVDDDTGQVTITNVYGQ